MVKFVKPSDIKGFYGMNYEASKYFHLKGYPKDTIEVDNRLGRNMKKEVIRHELIESSLMKKGLSYRVADEIATKFEKRKKL